MILQVAGMFFSHFLCYWAMVLYYDIDAENEPVIRSFSNQFCYTLPLIIAYCTCFEPVSYNLVSSFLLAILILPIVAEFYFYAWHRLLHTAHFFYLHRSHHSGSVSVINSLDSGPFEHCIVNLGTPMSGILMGNCMGYSWNIYCLCIWVAISTISVCSSHINKPSCLDKGYHMLHHHRLLCNYGFGFYLIDRFFGTFKYR
jgi:sterol desaturase/sphingolipid hydroxylase (fatty acid hydroxylase superfamily)